MFCGNCGNRIDDDANVCPQCGEVVAKDFSFQAVKEYAGHQLEKASTGVKDTMSSDYNNIARGKRAKSVTDIYVDPKEEQVAVVGENYLNNVLRGGAIGQGFGIVTDKRFYYRGKCLYRAGKGFYKMNEEWTVDLKDIVATGFVYERNYIWLVMAILFCWTIIGAIIFAILFFISHTAMYVVFTPGCSVMVKVSSYGINQVRAFDKKLRMAKDNCK